MARNKRLSTSPITGRGISRGVYEVLDRVTGQRYALLYLQNSGGWRFRLENYPHRMSKLFGSASTALEAVEREVF